MLSYSIVKSYPLFHTIYVDIVTSVMAKVMFSSLSVTCLFVCLFFVNACLTDKTWFCMLIVKGLISCNDLHFSLVSYHICRYCYLRHGKGYVFIIVCHHLFVCLFFVNACLTDKTWFCMLIVKGLISCNDLHFSLVSYHICRYCYLSHGKGYVFIIVCHHLFVCLFFVNACLTDKT